MRQASGLSPHLSASLRPLITLLPFPSRPPARFALRRFLHKRACLAFCCSALRTSLCPRSLKVSSGEASLSCSYVAAKGSHLSLCPYGRRLGLGASAASCYAAPPCGVSESETRGHRHQGVARTKELCRRDEDFSFIIPRESVPKKTWE